MYIEEKNLYIHSSNCRNLAEEIDIINNAIRPAYNFFLEKHHNNCNLVSTIIVTRVVCLNFGHPALTSVFTKYAFLQVKNSFATIVNELSVF